MINYSAAQAISPAIERTKQYLFQPFRWGTFLKLTLVALLTDGGMSSCNFNSHFPSGDGGGPSSPLHMPIPLPHMPWPAMAVVVMAIAAVAIIVIPIGIFISYLLIRLRFSFFHCVLTRQHEIAPAWARYHRQAMRFLGLSLCFALGFWLILIPIGYQIYQHFKALFQSIFSGVRPTFAELLPLIAVIGTVFLLLAVAAVLVDTALGYFVLPRMALEDASIEDALSDVWSDFLVEPWQYVFFILLRFLVTLVASIIGIIALAIPFGIAVAIGVVLVIILKAASTMVAVLLGVPAAILLLALFILAFIGVSGTIGTFRRNYGLLFYGSRYPLLGDILQPPPPLPPWQPGFAPGRVEGP
jgi:hypothetical protein